jgi:hypothetical protein
LQAPAHATRPPASTRPLRQAPDSEDPL